MYSLKLCNNVTKLMLRLNLRPFCQQLEKTKSSSSSLLLKYSAFGTASFLIFQNSNHFTKCEAQISKKSLINIDKLKKGIIKKNTKKTRVKEDESEEVLKKNDQGLNWKEFFKILLPHWKHLIVAIGSALVVAVINIKIPQLLGDVVNIIASFNRDDVREQLDLLKEPALKILTYYLIQSGFTFTYIYSLSCVGERVAVDLRKKLFHSVINQDISFFDTHMTGEIINRLTSDIQEFKSSFKICISQGLRSVCQTIGCMASLFYLSPEMTGQTLIAIPVIILVGSAFGSALRKLSRNAQSQVAKSTSVAEECVGNIRTVRAFSMEEKEFEMYSHEINKAQMINEKLGIGIGIFQAGSHLFLNGVVLGVLFLGGRQISSNQMTSGDLMNYLISAQTIQKSLQNISLLFGIYIRGIAAGGRVFKYINLEPKITNTKGIVIEDLKGDIEFKDVTFSYPTRDQDVLKNFNLKIPAGKVVALCGSSGSGKSTIVSLIERFYEVEKGSITLDGIPIKDLDLDWLRGHAIGIINQEPVLFATSVLENIRYGKMEATDEEVYESARLANCINFIKTFPKEFETVVGERGVSVSGGQKQRIAISRAIIKDPKILILDEATSALDTVSESQIQETLDRVIKGKTVIVIAHRLSTIQNADLIAVVDNGQIKELGTHDELYQKGGLYHLMVKQQEIICQQDDKKESFKK